MQQIYRQQYMIVLAVEVVIISISLYGFISQLLLLRKNKHIGSFSIYFPHIILSCNILKVFFWIIKPFAISMLIQSFLLIVINLLLLKECVQLKKNSPDLNQGYLANAFRWKNFRQHITFVILFTLSTLSLTFLSLTLRIQIIGDIFAYLATIIQISQCLPQIISSYKTKSVAGVSHTMIGIWLLVDSLKTVYFISNEQPIQFILTGSILVVFDLVLVMQIIAYGSKNAKQQ